MIWFLERNSDLLICEIRHCADAAAYEFEIVATEGPPDSQRFTSAAELIQSYLRTQTLLQAEGWRPRLGDIAALGD